MKKRLAKKVYRHRSRYPKHMVKKALVRLFPPGLLRVYMPPVRIIEDNSIKDLKDIDDSKFIGLVEQVTRSGR